MRPRCQTCGQPERRSAKSNAAYWCLLNAIAIKLRVDGEQFDAKAWHVLFAERFLPQQEVRLPNGELLLFRTSTGDLGQSAFSDYLAKIEVWASERGVWLEDKEN